MKSIFTILLVAVFIAAPNIAFGGEPGGNAGGGQGGDKHGGHKPRVGGHDKIHGNRHHMNHHASQASQYMNQMANFGKLMDPLLRKDLNNSLNQLNQGSKAINDLVNKEGYDAGSATEEYQGYLKNFKLPDLSQLQTRDLEQLEKKGSSSAPAEVYVPKDSAESQLMGLLADNGYAPTEANLRMLQDATEDSDGSKQKATTDSLAPTTPSDRVVVVMNSAPGEDHRLDNLDAIVVEASKEVAKEHATGGTLTLANNASQEGGNNPAAVAGALDEEKLVSPEEAEMILGRQLGSVAEAKAILAQLKKKAAGQPTTFSKLFHAFQEKYLADYLANRQLHGLSTHDALARAMGETTSEQSSEAPMALIVLLVIFAICSYFLFGAMKRDAKRETRKFVVRGGEPRWASWLKSEAIPPAPKSSRFKKAVEGRSKAS